MKQTTHGYSSGFTIVELIIVIVVIAILAVISVVAYTNIQQRARNTQTVAAVKAYVQALELYVQDNGQYIVAPGLPVAGVCLGRGYASEECWSGSDGTYTPSTYFDTQLSAYLPTKPTIAPKYHTEGVNSNQLSGIVYFRYIPVGRQSIDYILEGSNQACIVAGATVQNGSLGGGTGTRCRLVLPET